ncbi:MAG: tetratricopeptide repeat protein [Deltaproteobacteria bacterium]|nr:tetratricopeptide repeat protein [Deltaproteobacteria bacterium]
MRRLTATAFLLLGALVAWTGVGAADETVVSEARASFTLGEQAFQRGAFEEALAHFRRAWELSPHDAARFNLAVCLEALGRLQEALAEYEAAAASSSLGSEQRERATRDAAGVRARLGTVSIEGEPAGASVVLDRIERCALPCRLTVDPGTHVVEVVGQAGRTRARLHVGEGEETSVRLDALVRRTERPGRTERPRQPAPTTRPGRGPGWLAWSGAALAVVGAGAGVVLGLRTEALHQDYLDSPSEQLRDEGLSVRAFANGSFVAAGVGLLAVTFDLLVLAPATAGRDDSSR